MRVFEAVAATAPQLLPVLAARLLPALSQVLDEAAAAQEAAAAEQAAAEQAAAEAQRRQQQGYGGGGGGGGAAARGQADLWQRPTGGGGGEGEAASEDEGEGEGEDGWGEDASGSIDPLEPALCLLDSVLLKRWPRDAPLPEARRAPPPALPPLHANCPPYAVHCPPHASALPSPAPRTLPMQLPHDTTGGARRAAAAAIARRRHRHRARSGSSRCRTWP